MKLFFLNFMPQYSLSPIKISNIPPWTFPAKSSLLIISNSPLCVFINDSLAMADAQLLAVKRASRKSSVSASLMARICSSAADHLSSAQGILASCPNKRELEDDLITYVSQDRELAQAAVYRWMGQDVDKAGK